MIAGSGLLLTVIALSPGTQDTCVSLIPPKLSQQLKAAFPAYRLPRATDQDAFNVNESLKRGGSGCLGVAVGDFDGDRQQDIALLLSAKSTVKTLVLVALRRSARWTLERIDGWDGPISSYYVDTVTAGAYESPWYGESPPRPNELPSIKSATEGVAAGQLESTALFFFRVNGKWRFLWMAD